MNNITLIGRNVREVETIKTEKTTVAKFTLAVTRDYKKDEVDFIKCVAFGKLAETVSKYVGKGKKVAVNGRLQTGSFTNKKGDKVNTSDVIVNTLSIIEWKEEGAV